MSNHTWKRDEPDSPCVNICVIHPKVRICIGCYRTADEIENWPAMTGSARRAIKDNLSERAPQLRNRRGGRAARRAQKPG